MKPCKCRKSKRNNKILAYLFKLAWKNEKDLKVLENFDCFTHCPWCGKKLEEKVDDV